MKVEYKKDYEGFKAGQIVEWDEKTAKNLINANIVFECIEFHETQPRSLRDVLADNIEKQPFKWTNPPEVEEELKNIKERQNKKKNRK